MKKDDFAAALGYICLCYCFLCFCCYFIGMIIDLLGGNKTNVIFEPQVEPEHKQKNIIPGVNN